MSDAAKVFVINPNNWYNKGDVTNRLGLVEGIRNALGNDAVIAIETLTSKEDSEYFRKYDVGVVESIFSTDNKRTIFLRAMIIARNILLLFSSLIFYTLLKNRVDLEFLRKKQTFLKALIDAEIVISSPGGFLQDYNTSSSLLVNLFLVFFSLLLKKPVIVYAQSVGPFRNKVIRFLCRQILNRVDAVIVREEISQRYLEDSNITRPRTYLTADATFSVRAPQHFEEEFATQMLGKISQEDKRVLVGITILGDYIPYLGKGEMFEKYVAILADAANYAINKLNATIILVPQVLNESERTAMHLLARSVVNRERVILIDKDLPPEDVMKLIGCTELFIGTRMHSNIFALIMNVPIIAIAYEHKTHGIMKMLGLEDWVLDIRDLNSSKLISMIDELYRRRLKVKTHISKTVKEARLRSLQSAEIVKKIYQSKVQAKPR